MRFGNSGFPAKKRGCQIERAESRKATGATRNAGFGFVGRNDPIWLEKWTEQKEAIASGDQD